MSSYPYHHKFEYHFALRVCENENSLERQLWCVRMSSLGSVTVDCHDRKCRSQNANEGPQQVMKTRGKGCDVEQQLGVGSSSYEDGSFVCLVMGKFHKLSLEACCQALPSPFSNFVSNGSEGYAGRKTYCSCRNVNMASHSEGGRR